MRKNFIFKMSVVFVMGIMALGQVSCSSKTETNVDKEGEASSESQGDVFFQTRGIILSWDDVKKPEVLDWLKLSENAGITTLSVFGADIYSAEYQEFVSKCREKSIDIEYQEHMMATLLPRDLFKEHPAYFRMDENGKRMQSSSRGIKMAELPVEKFEEAIRKVVKLNERFVPPYESGAALYIRPLMIGRGFEYNSG